MDIASMKYFHLAEELVDVFCKKTQNPDRGFYRLLTAYNFSKMSAMMRTEVSLPGRGAVPTNMYSISLAPSGYSKGYSTHIMENEVIGDFMELFSNSSFDAIAETNLLTLANKRSSKKGTDPDDEHKKLTTEFERVGEILPSFSEATVPAVKQYRRKLQLANAGAVNFEVDEIGANLLKSQDVLIAYLELYDAGHIKEKLVKNTVESIRGAALEGGTPTNMSLFGTPSKLLDGGTTEKMLMMFLEMGYARRSFFGLANRVETNIQMTDEEMYDFITSGNTDDELSKFSSKFMMLADPMNFNKTIRMDRTVGLELVKYKSWCERLALDIPEHEEIRKSELLNRFFKVGKLAATYAFVSNQSSVSMAHLHGAIKLAEDSAEALLGILKRDRDYVRLAKFIAHEPKPVTVVDICASLPFFDVSANKRADMLTHAIAWGYKNNVVLTKSVEGGIEFFTGSTLQSVDLENIRIAHGPGLADGYQNETPAFDKLDRLFVLDNYNWVNHALEGSHRSNDKTLKGFDVVVLDIDGTFDMDLAKLLMKDYKYVLHTTKSHKPAGPHHYRMVLPMNYRLELDAEDYAEFMENVYSWVPISVDTGTKDRCRKWATAKDCHVEYNDGVLLDALNFIPKTSKNDLREAESKKLGDLSAIERWFIQDTAPGNRNNNLAKYALMLVDAGEEFIDIQEMLYALNSKISVPMDKARLDSTILRTVQSRISKRNTP